MADEISRRSMIRLGALAPVAIALAATQVPTAAAAATGALPSVVPSRKKGVGVARLVPQGAYRVQAMNPAWYYTWAADGIDAVQSVEFVPMVWGGTYIQKQIDDVRALGPGKRQVVLGCNEPDGAKQSNMTVDQVLNWWPDIKDLAARTVAPAPVNPFNPWYQEFVQKAAAQGLTWNYVAVHNYPGADAAGFLSTIDQVYEAYGLPIWITEFAVADWSATSLSTNRYQADQVLDFMKTVLPELERRPHVERYAWFGAGPAAATSPKLGPSALFDTTGTMTALGRFYAQFGTGASSAGGSY